MSKLPDPELLPRNVLVTLVRRIQAQVWRPTEPQESPATTVHNISESLQAVGLGPIKEDV